MGKAPFKMKGHELPGPNQKKSPVPMAAALIGMVKEKKDDMGKGLTKAFESVGNSPKKEDEKTVKASE
tara:strand:+ start:2363 stop:2566 length:204 start_codon:yes stop_codon:yes gene_type:complete